MNQVDRALKDHEAFQNAYHRPIMSPPNLVTPLQPAKGAPYEGPFPDAFVEILVKNQGKATAYEVTTWLTVEKSALEPVVYFAGKGIEVISEKEGKITVEMQAQRDGGRLLPSENDWQRFQVPVLRHQTENSTVVHYEITSPQGGGVEDATDLPLYISGEPQAEHE